MSCSQSDLKDYFLGEPGVAGRGAVEEHLKACPSCREELDRLRLLGTALASVPDEEMPHRIAFVSDKIFEPRGWARFWGSAPRLGFASAAMLSAAIILHGFISTVETRRTAEIVAAAEHRIQEQRQQDLANMEDSVAWLQKKMNTYYVSSASYGGRP